MLELACLYYEVRKRFYNTDFETYCEACQELHTIAHQLGFTNNGIVKILIAP